MVLLKRVNNMFLLSMALAGLFVGVFGILAQIPMYLFLVRKEVNNMDTFKLLGIIPFYIGTHMSILSIGVMTADRFISVQNSLRCNTTMTEFRAKILILLTWVITAAITIAQGIIYLCISPQTEIIARAYLSTMFVLIGSTVLSVPNTKLYSIINAKLKRTSTSCTTNGTTRYDPNENVEKLETRVMTIVSRKMKTQYNSKEYGGKSKKGKSTEANSMKMADQEYLGQTEEGNLRETTTVTILEKIKTDKNSVQTDDDSTTVTTLTTVMKPEMATQHNIMNSNLSKSKSPHYKKRDRIYPITGIRESIKAKYAFG